MMQHYLYVIYSSIVSAILASPFPSAQADFDFWDQTLPKQNDLISPDQYGSPSTPSSQNLATQPIPFSFQEEEVEDGSNLRAGESLLAIDPANHPDDSQPPELNNNERQRLIDESAKRLIEQGGADLTWNFIIRQVIAAEARLKKAIAENATPAEVEKAREALKNYQDLKDAIEKQKRAQEAREGDSTTTEEGQNREGNGDDESSGRASLFQQMVDVAPSVGIKLTGHALEIAIGLAMPEIIAAMILLIPVGF